MNFGMNVVYNFLYCKNNKIMDAQSPSRRGLRRGLRGLSVDKDFCGVSLHVSISSLYISVSSLSHLGEANSRLMISSSKNEFTK